MPGTSPRPLSAEESAREGAVLDRIGASADADGFVPFDRFMELALYADGIGVYASTSPPLGPAGDFYTAPHVHPLFGRTLAQRVREVRARLSPTRPFRIVEVGAGDGTLASAIVAEDLRGDPPPTYVLVERSAPLRALALERTRRAAGDRGIGVETAGSIGGIGPFAGVVIAHELFDALPVRRLVFRRGEWKELGVRRVGDRLEAAASAMRDPVPSLDADPPPEDGEVREIAPAALGTLRAIADHLVEGLAIVVDYGMEERELRSAHRTGTLAGVRRHRFVDDPLSHPGLVDLSAFVNFTRLRADAARCGLTEVAFTSQAEALGRWGFAALRDAAIRSAPSAESRVEIHLAAKNLLFGFERFRVLELAPGSAGARPT